MPKGKGRELVVDPAVRGVENVLSSVHKAGTVEVVVMTSSIIAVMGGKNMEDPQHVFTEAGAPAPPRRIVRSGNFYNYEEYRS